MKKIYKRSFNWINPLDLFNFIYFNDNEIKDIVFLHSCNSLNPSINILQNSKFSYIAINPKQKVIAKNKTTYIDGLETNYDNPFDALNELFKLDEYEKTFNSEYEFIGGALGWFGYDLYHYVESMDAPSKKMQDEYDDLNVGIYDAVIIFNHEHKHIDVVYQCEKDLKTLSDYITNYVKHDVDISGIKYNVEKLQSYSQYENMIGKTLNYIYEGDIFQANITQPYVVKNVNHDAGVIYNKLVGINPAPFCAFIKNDDFCIMSSSPERFLKVYNDGLVETRPIKGTAKRYDDEDSDKASQNNLLNSEKDRSENIMIVDLLRNDLSKVSKPGSVTVPILCGIETYESVHHLVSVVRSKLENSCTAMNLLKNCFPGGSITGAPKIRAMEIIDELEKQQRGLYCGSVGYYGYDGAMDTSITIRTMVMKNNNITFNSGGGIVYESSVESEYKESLQKALKLAEVFENDINN